MYEELKALGCGWTTISDEIGAQPALRSVSARLELDRALGIGDQPMQIV